MAGILRSLFQSLTSSQAPSSAPSSAPSIVSSIVQSVVSMDATPLRRWFLSFEDLVVSEGRDELVADSMIVVWYRWGQDLRYPGRLASWFLRFHDDTMEDQSIIELGIIAARNTSLIPVEYLIDMFASKVREEENQGRFPYRLSPQDIVQSAESLSTMDLSGALPPFPHDRILPTRYQVLQRNPGALLGRRTSSLGRQPSKTGTGIHQGAQDSQGSISQPSQPKPQSTSSSEVGPLNVALRMPNRPSDSYTGSIMLTPVGGQNSVAQAQGTQGQAPKQARTPRLPAEIVVHVPRDTPINIDELMPDIESSIYGMVQRLVSSEFEDASLAIREDFGDLRTELLAVMRQDTATTVQQSPLAIEIKKMMEDMKEEIKEELLAEFQQGIEPGMQGNLVQALEQNLEEIVPPQLEQKDAFIDSCNEIANANTTNSSRLGDGEPDEDGSGRVEIAVQTSTEEKEITEIANDVQEDARFTLPQKRKLSDVEAPQTNKRLRYQSTRSPPSSVTAPTHTVSEKSWSLDGFWSEKRSFEDQPINLVFDKFSHQFLVQARAHDRNSSGEFVCDFTEIEKVIYGVQIVCIHLKDPDCPIIWIETAWARDIIKALQTGCVANISLHADYFLLIELEKWKAAKASKS